MAFQISCAFPPVLHPITASPKLSPSPRFKPTRIFFTQPIITTTNHSATTKRKSTQFAIKATITNNNNKSEEEEEEAPQSNSNSFEPQIASSTPNEPESQSTNSTAGDVSDLGSEIKKAMMERRGGGGGDFWSGVAEEVREIEWPAFGKVLGTTGVVLGVIAGSSVVLLTVNAVLAELSDRVFAGKGVRDFFG